MPSLVKNLLLIMGVGFALYALLKTDMAKTILKSFEGFSATPYKDAAGFWTIGYGHKIVPGDPYYPVGGEGVKASVTEDEAETLLENDMASARAAVLSYTKVPLSAGQLDALTSLVYNIGPTAFYNSTLLKKLNAGDVAGAAGEFGRWVYAGGQKLLGLTNRREAEKQVFLS